MYISVQLLEQGLTPNHSLTAKRWLFADLTEDMDALVLKLLSDSTERAGRRRFSININLASVATDAFRRFDADIPPEQKGDIVIEISKTDYFENTPLYRRVVPFLREKGYKILFDGLTMETVQSVDFDGIDCDFAKLFWNADAANYPEAIIEKMKVKLVRPKPRFVLARCDTAESVRYARTMGIKLVQGRLIDHMVKRSIPL